MYLVVDQHKGFICEKSIADTLLLRIFSYSKMLHKQALCQCIV